MAAVVLASCSGGKNGGEEETETEGADSVAVVAEDTLQLLPKEEVPEAADQNFDDFFYSFVSDEDFQKQRVHFPLHCTSEEGADLSESEWDTEQRFASQEIYCVLFDREKDFEIQKDTSLREVNVSWVSLTQGRFQTFRFIRPHKQWRLADFNMGQLSKSRQAHFLKFYAQFVTDTIFQLERVNFPLCLVVQPEDGSEKIETQLSPDEWSEYRSELPLPTHVMTLIDYGQASLSENRKILMMEALSSGYSITFKFDRTNEQWKLYQVEN